MCHHTNDPTWSVLGWSAKVAVKKWAEELLQHNFQHKVYLLETEEAFCDNDTKKACTYDMKLQCPWQKSTGKSMD
jgi:hypothetical protein